MASGSDLRDLVRDDGARGNGGLDADAIIRGARRRRLPRRLAAGGVAVLAVAAIAIPAAVLVRTLPVSTSSAGSSAEEPADTADGGALGREDGPQVAGGAGGCAAAPLAGAADRGLAVTVAFPATAAGATTAAGTVTITNTGTTTVSGWLASSPTVVAARDGRTAAVAVGALPRAATRIDLAPGASLAYPVTLPLEDCADGTTALAAGSYAVSATIQFSASAPGATTTDSSTAVALVGGAASVLTVG